MDTDLIGKGFGIAAVGIGTSIAFKAMKDAMHGSHSKKYRCYDDKWFNPPRFRL